MVEVYIDDENLELLFVSRITKCAYYAVGHMPIYNAYARAATGTGWSFTSDNDLFSEGGHIYIGTFSTFDQFASSYPELLV